MAIQGEQVQGGLELDVVLLGSVAQDKTVMQEKPIPEGLERHQSRSSGRFFLL